MSLQNDRPPRFTESHPEANTDQGFHRPEKWIGGEQKASQGVQQQEGWRSHEDATQKPINAEELYHRLQNEQKKSKPDKKLETMLKRDQALAGMEETETTLA